MLRLGPLIHSGKSIVMVTHDPHSASAASRVIHLDKGKFVEAEAIVAAV